MNENERREYLTDLSIEDLISIVRDRYKSQTGKDASNEAFIRQAMISMVFDTEEEVV